LLFIRGYGDRCSISTEIERRKKKKKKREEERTPVRRLNILVFAARVPQRAYFQYVSGWRAYYSPEKYAGKGRDRARENAVGINTATGALNLAKMTGNELDVSIKKEKEERKGKESKKK